MPTSANVEMALLAKPNLTPTASDDIIELSLYGFMLEDTVRTLGLFSSVNYRPVARVKGMKLAQLISF